MSATAIAQPLLGENKLTVSFRLLLGLYAIIPLCLLLQGVDSWFWQGYLQAHLPSSPNHFILFQILFGTPHIIASAIVLGSNVDYLQFYKRNILLMTLAVIMVFGVGSLFIPYKVLYIIVAAWTVFHVLKQQHGIGRGVCALPNWAFNVLLWLSVAAGICIYIGIFLKNVLDMQQAEWLKYSAAVLSTGVVLSALLCQGYVKTSFGRWFLWANVLLVVSSFYFYLQQYYFFAILVPRLVHDATAYVFYVTHDYNRHHQHPQNRLYRLTERCGIHVFIVLPVLSFALAFMLQSYGDAMVSFITQALFGVDIRKAITLGLLGYLALLHYYTEAITWKHGSPYRRFIAFSK
ncbi:MAG: hypothetical protein Q8Q40_13790 [Methylococcaceae bacterium]|nr:hypothetical protein [Methylococcaceae bacterium]MDP3905029.1 hypothetical protein [Methylococcaceae bacterium]